MPNVANPFATMATANASGGGNWIKDGIYKFMVEKVHLHTGQSTCFIAELRVLEAQADGSVDANGKPVVPNAVGSSCSLVCDLVKHASAPGNAKAFAIGALGGLGYTEAQVDEQMMVTICGANNPLRGVVVGDTTYRKPIKSGPNQGKPITLHKWQPLAQDATAIKAGRAYLDQHAAVADVAASMPAAAAPAGIQTQQVTAPVVTPAPVAAPLTGALADLLK